MRKWYWKLKLFDRREPDWSQGRAMIMTSIMQINRCVVISVSFLPTLLGSSDVSCMASSAPLCIL